jgi:hypothetical protein
MVAFTLHLLHILFMAWFVGSGIALTILWIRNRGAVRETRLPDAAGMLAIARYIHTLAGTFLLLTGVLMVIQRPGMLSSGHFLAKAILGVVAVGISHYAQAKIRQIWLAWTAHRPVPRPEKIMDILAVVIPILGALVIFMGVSWSHG